MKVDWNNIRKQFPILENYTYLNTARFCALPSSVIESQKLYLDHLASDGSWHFERWIEDYENARTLTSLLLECQTENVFFIPNVSTGINLSLKYLHDLPVVLVKDDFPSVTLPWHLHNRLINEVDRRKESFYEDLEMQLRKGRRILCVSWIQSEDGFEIDLPRIYEMIRISNSILVLDGTQGFSTIPLQIDPDVSMVFLSSGFKWMLAGYGIAIGYLSSDILASFKAFSGWNSIDHHSHEIKPGAASLEVGNAMYLNSLGLREGLGIIDRIGIDKILDRNQYLKQILINALEERGMEFESPSNRSSILRIKTTKYEQLTSKKIQTTDQGDWIRISHHFYNDEEDIQRLMEALID